MAQTTFEERLKKELLNFIDHRSIASSIAEIKAAVLEHCIPELGYAGSIKNQRTEDYFAGRKDVIESITEKIK